MGGLGEWRPGTKVDTIRASEIEYGRYEVTLFVGDEERRTEVSKASEDYDRRYLAAILTTFGVESNDTLHPVRKLLLARAVDRIWASLDA